MKHPSLKGCVVNVVDETRLTKSNMDLELEKKNINFKSLKGLSAYL